MFQIQANPKWDGKQRYPLLIWLHGAGQSGDDNEAQMGGAPKVLLTPESQGKNPCFFIAPQCPSRDIGWKNEVADNLIALIADLSERLPIDENRIILGSSCDPLIGSFTAPAVAMGSRPDAALGAELL